MVLCGPCCVCPARPHLLEHELGARHSDRTQRQVIPHHQDHANTQDPPPFQTQANYDGGRDIFGSQLFVHEHRQVFLRYRPEVYVYMLCVHFVYKLIVLCKFSAHLIACGFLFIGFEEDGWLSEPNAGTTYRAQYVVCKSFTVYLALI